jgi:hypothetical protein
MNRKRLEEIAPYIIPVSVAINWLAHITIYAETGFTTDDRLIKNPAQSAVLKVGIAAGSMMLSASIAALLSAPKGLQRTNINQNTQRGTEDGSSAQLLTGTPASNTQTEAATPKPCNIWLASIPTYFILNLGTELLPELLSGVASTQTQKVLNEVFTEFWPIHIMKALISIGVGSFIAEVGNSRKGISTKLSFGGLSAGIFLNTLIGPTLFAAINSLDPAFGDMLKNALGGAKNAGLFNLLLSTTVPILFGALKTSQIGNSSFVQNNILPKGRTTQRGVTFLITAGIMMLGANVPYIFSDHISPEAAKQFDLTFLLSPGRVYGLAAVVFLITDKLTNQCSQPSCSIGTYGLGTQV